MFPGPLLSIDFQESEATARHRRTRHPRRTVPAALAVAVAAGANPRGGNRIPLPGSADSSRHAASTTDHRSRYRRQPVGRTPAPAPGTGAAAGGSAAGEWSVEAASAAHPRTVDRSGVRRACPAAAPDVVVAAPGAAVLAAAVVHVQVAPVVEPADVAAQGTPARPTTPLRRTLPAPAPVDGVAARRCEAVAAGPVPAGASGADRLASGGEARPRNRDRSRAAHRRWQVSHRGPHPVRPALAGRSGRG